MILLNIKYKWVTRRMIKSCGWPHQFIYLFVFFILELNWRKIVSKICWRDVVQEFEVLDWGSNPHRLCKQKLKFYNYLYIFYIRKINQPPIWFRNCVIGFSCYLLFIFSCSFTLLYYYTFSLINFVSYIR